MTNAGERGGLARILTQQSFDPEGFVAKQSSKGEDNLLDMRQKVHALNDDTAQLLKKNVYKNYSQFIETAKEISILEGDMYQLSNLLTEQKSLMSAMMELSLVSKKAMMDGVKDGEQDIVEDETQHNLAFFLEKVEGCSRLSDVVGRHLIYDTDLVEVEPETCGQLQRMHAFLLNDSLMMATWVPARRGLVKYRFCSLYELDCFAVVNVRDSGPFKNAFKILMFPEAIMYQTDSAKSKRQFLDILEDTKKKKALKEKQRKESTGRQPELFSPTDSGSQAVSGAENERVAMDADFLQIDWLQESPEDLDMLIAQRNFESAVDCVEKVFEYLKDCPNGPSLTEYRARVEHRVKQLTDGLISELQVSAERALRGGPRTARLAVTQLIRLGRSNLACELFLKNRSAVIRYNIRQLKFEGAATLYVRCLCSVFFSNLYDKASEFSKVFASHYNCYSALVMWARQELASFVTLFCRQVFESKASLSTIAECVTLAKTDCTKLSTIGLDMEFCMMAMISPRIQQVIEATSLQTIDGIRYRLEAEHWLPWNLHNQEECRKLVSEMNDLCFDIEPYVFDGCFIVLTTSTVHFAKMCKQLVADLMRLHSAEFDDAITISLETIFVEQLTQFHSALNNEKYSAQRDVIMQNARFVGDKVILLVFSQYRQSSLPLPQRLLNVQAMYVQVA